MYWHEFCLPEASTEETRGFISSVFLFFETLSENLPVMPGHCLVFVPMVIFLRGSTCKMKVGAYSSTSSSQHSPEERLCGNWEKPVFVMVYCGKALCNGSWWHSVAMVTVAKEGWSGDWAPFSNDPPLLRVIFSSFDACLLILGGINLLVCGCSAWMCKRNGLQFQHVCVINFSWPNQVVLTSVKPNLANYNRHMFSLINFQMSKNTEWFSW